MGNFFSQYSSPIDIKKCDALKCHQHIQLCGQNLNAEYDSRSRNFYINPEDRIILTLNGKEYRLMEYHFHLPSSHTVEGEKYSAEIHFVFAKSNKDVCKYKFDLCCYKPSNNNQEFEPEEDDSLLVLTKFISNNLCFRGILSNIQPSAPHNYYSYDGRLVTGDQAIPVRWIIDMCPIGLPLYLIESVAKESGEIQPFDNRILLHSCC